MQNKVRQLEKKKEAMKKSQENEKLGFMREKGSSSNNSSKSSPTTVAVQQRSGDGVEVLIGCGFTAEGKSLRLSRILKLLFEEGVNVIYEFRRIQSPGSGICCRGFCRRRRQWSSNLKGISGLDPRCNQPTRTHEMAGSVEGGRESNANRVAAARRREARTSLGVSESSGAGGCWGWTVVLVYKRQQQQKRKGGEDDDKPAAARRQGGVDDGGWRWVLGLDGGVGVWEGGGQQVAERNLGI